MATCIHRRERDQCFVCMLQAVDEEPICSNCGNDIVMEGEKFCTQCLYDDEDLYSRE